MNADSPSSWDYNDITVLTSWFVSFIYSQMRLVTRCGKCRGKKWELHSYMDFEDPHCFVGFCGFNP